MKYNTILLDFDDTLVDFMMPKIKLFTIWPNIIIITQQQKTFNFKQINQAHWEAFQKNKLTKDEVLSQIH